MTFDLPPDSEDDTPDWLKDLQSEDEFSSSDDSGELFPSESDDDSPEWLADQDQGEGSSEGEANVPDWLSGIRESEESLDASQVDFSDLTEAGVYRAVLPGVAGHSFQFFINDGTFSQLPRLFLDFVHDRRSGDFENDWRGPSHLDDAIRSDTGEQIDCVGGWYDAGDLRKWMSMTMIPALGFLDVYERLDLSWNHFASEQVTDNDFITETIWGVKFILKMQD